MKVDRNSSVVILTGAGISAESGIRTFRGSDGLWENHRLEDVATPEAFERDPELVLRFYNQRRAQLRDPAVQPNRAHLELARWEREWPGEFLLVTQNVDDLHDRAGSRRLVHMHGELLSVFCGRCRHQCRWAEDLLVSHPCPVCGGTASLRPDIVWFGEMPYGMDRIEKALSRADLFVAIGTSGQVYPAAGFAAWAPRARKIEINTEDTPVSPHFHERLRGPATDQVPRLIERFLSSK